MTKYDYVPFKFITDFRVAQKTIQEGITYTKLMPALFKFNTMKTLDSPLCCKSGEIHYRSTRSKESGFWQNIQEPLT